MPAIVKTIVIREESTLVKTIVVNRGPRGPAGSLESYRATTQSFTLTSQDIFDKKITLSHIPANNSVFLIPDGGAPQRIGIDFDVVNSNEISWNGLRLDGFLEEGETIYITYQVRM